MRATGKVVIAPFTFFYVNYGKHQIPLRSKPSYHSPAPYAWLLGDQYVNHQLRAFTYALATALNFLSNWAGTFSAHTLSPQAGSAGDQSRATSGSGVTLFV